MKKDKRKILKRIIVVVTIVLGTTIIVFFRSDHGFGHILIRGLVSSGVKAAQEKRVKLLYEMDTVEIQNTTNNSTN